jgi:hypothetical protein
MAWRMSLAPLHQADGRTIGAPRPRFKLRLSVVGPTLQSRSRPSGEHRHYPAALRSTCTRRASLARTTTGQRLSQKQMYLVAFDDPGRAPDHRSVGDAGMMNQHGLFSPQSQAEPFPPVTTATMGEPTVESRRRQSRSRAPSVSLRAPEGVSHSGALPGPPCWSTRLRQLCVRRSRGRCH